MELRPPLHFGVEAIIKEAFESPSIKVANFTCFLLSLTLSAGAVEYIDCNSVEEYNPPNECPGYGTKQSDSEFPVMWSASSWPSLPGPLWPGVVAPDRVLSMA